MKSRLNEVQDWTDLARRAAYSAHKLAEHCGVSLRQLERFFLLSKQRSPQRWLREIRMSHALELVRQPLPIKEVAFQLSYQAPGNFTRDFKRHFGVCPSQAGTLIVQLGFGLQQLSLA